jgi:hypothetical protein
MYSERREIITFIINITECILKEGEIITFYYQYPPLLSEYIH